ncbi:hypothetical protein [Luteipulveratus mongoliensis]|uniref:hypothetical protein n=1 Tax=Luteipulveratus mongoliensis TaxID=571913 RepID=UPI0012ECC8D3|nr:hypothetical protein [Luteipulveratus mongoliensis]
MNSVLADALAGAAGGCVVIAFRYLAGCLARFRRGQHGRDRLRASRYVEPHAVVRAGQLRAYADHLAHGDDRLREHLRRFEQPGTPRGGDQPW